jgi:hypothetical protein
MATVRFGASHPVIRTNSDHESRLPIQRRRRLTSQSRHWHAIAGHHHSRTGLAQVLLLHGVSGKAAHLAFWRTLRIFPEFNEYTDTPTTG